MTQKQQLSPEQIRQLTNDLDDFFSGRRGGHLDKWSYVDSTKWEALVVAATRRYSPYYLSVVEQPVLFKNAGRLAEVVENRKDIIDENTPKQGVTTLFVRGPGTGEKIVPIVGAINGQLNHVLLFDLSRDFTSIAAHRLSAIRPDLSISELNFDFEAPQNGSRIHGSSLGLELGATLFNIPNKPDAAFPKEALRERFSRMAGQYGRGQKSWALVTQHINQDASGVVKCYSDKFNREFALNALELANQIPGTENFDPSALFEHTPTLIELGNGNRVVAHMARPKFTEPVTFRIGGKEYTIAPDFRNSTINSYLPTEEMFKECAESKDAGFKVIDTYYDEDKKIAIHLMELPALARYTSQRSWWPPRPPMMK
jgi:hypothetical protein